MAGYRRGEPEHVERVTWTIARAQAAGFMRRGRNGELSQYETQPRTMLYARAAGDVARRIAPDVLLGIPEDADEPNSGNAPEATITVRRAPMSHPAAPGEAPRGDAHDATGLVSQSTPEDAPSGPENAAPNSPSGETAQVVDELTPEPTEPAITGAQSAMLHALYRARGMERDAYLQDAARFVGRELSTTAELTKAEASRLIDSINADAADDRRRERS